MDMTHAYNNKKQPLSSYKRVVWYDDSKNINRLKELANILNLKSIRICGEKDDDSDIAIVRTNNKGTGLILENCHLAVEILDFFESIIIKDCSEQKTKIIRGEEYVI